LQPAAAAPYYFGELEGALIHGTRTSVDHGMIGSDVDTEIKSKIAFFSLHLSPLIQNLNHQWNRLLSCLLSLLPSLPTTWPEKLRKSSLLEQWAPSHTGHHACGCSEPPAVSCRPFRVNQAPLPSGFRTRSLFAATIGYCNGLKLTGIIYPFCEFSEVEEQAKNPASNDPNSD